MIIDSHCHLTYEPMSSSLDETIIRANKIIVLDQGKIVDSGTHAELLGKSNIYKNLYNKQLRSN